MSKYVRFPQLFNADRPSAPAFYLTTLLNKLGVSVQALHDLRIADKPTLVHGLVWAACNFERGERRGEHYDLTKAKASLRRILRRHTRRREVREVVMGGPEASRLLCRETTKGDNVYWPTNVENSMKRLIADIVRKAELYDFNGKACSGILSSFSYDQMDDYDYQLSLYRELRCPNCASNETVLAEGEYYDGVKDDVEELCNQSDDFEHLTGPYCRCNQCDAVIRPEVGEASSLPDSHNRYSDDNDWEDYIEGLDYGLEELSKRLQDAGFPKPDKLQLHNSNCDWRGREGYATCDFDGKALAERMSVRGDFCITSGRFIYIPAGAKVPGRVASSTEAYGNCVLSHHDASGCVTIAPAWETETDSSVLLDLDGVAESRNVHQPLVETLCAGRDNVFEFTVGSDLGLMNKEQAGDCLQELGRRIQQRVSEADDDSAESVAAESLALLIGCLAGEELPQPAHIRELVEHFINATA